MCPSYMVTREEEHSTRGRARLLFEMLHGDPLEDGWHSDAVHEALDLCLACKGCKGDCPVNVDMATYKAEFLSHYYEGRLRPRHAYSMGLIYWWARLASLAPRAVNLVSHAPILSRVAKALGGIAPERTIPRFANQTFHVMVPAQGGREPRWRPRCSCGRTHSTITSTRPWPGRRWKFWSTPASSVTIPAAQPLLRPAAL